MEDCAVAGKRRNGPFEDLAGRLALLFQHGHIPHCDREVDRGSGHLQFHGALRGPHAGAILFTHIQDFIDQPLAGLFVDFAEDATGSLDQVTVEFPLIPLVVHVVQLVVAQAEAAFHQVVCLGQKLHQRVLDAVVYRLDEMAG